MARGDTALLPNGLQDLLFPDAEKEATAVQTLMGAFKSFGYLRVKPPLLEFEESLLAGPGQVLSRQTFRLMDPVSQRMMGLRADMTAQISRIAATRLSGEARPLRFAYAADVLRVNGTQLRPDRQFCQVGCELIGDETPRSDAEMMVMAIKGLYDLGIRDITIDLTIPMLVDMIFDAHDADDDTRVSLKEALSRRDYDALDLMKDQLNQTLGQLLSSLGPARDNIETLKGVILPEAAAQSVVLLDRIYNELQTALDVYGLSEGVSVTIDVVEHKGAQYHTGVGFNIFARGFRGELGSGGRYNSIDYNAEKHVGESATGFTIYMDSVLRALPDNADEDFEYVSGDDGWDTIKALQDQGKKVIRKG